MKQLNLFNKQEKEFLGVTGENLFTYKGKNGLYSFGFQIDNLIAQGMKAIVVSPNSFAIYNRSLTSKEIKSLIDRMNETKGIEWNS